MCIRHWAHNLQVSNIYFLYEGYRDETHLGARKPNLSYSGFSLLMYVLLVWEYAYATVQL